jgi:hypothetical protein
VQVHSIAEKLLSEDYSFGDAVEELTFDQCIEMWQKTIGQCFLSNFAHDESSHWLALVDPHSYYGARRWQYAFFFLPVHDQVERMVAKGAVLLASVAGGAGFEHERVIAIDYFLPLIFGCALVQVDILTSGKAEYTFAICALCFVEL